jgi:ferredoxin-nitrite reductase
MATPLDVFVEPSQATLLCAEIALLFRDHGSRAARNRARLAFLIDAWGAAMFRNELQRRLAFPLLTDGQHARIMRNADHLGVRPQKQRGLNYVGLAVPVGRLTARLLAAGADAATSYGNGELRLTTNIVIPNIPDDRLPRVLRDPLVGELPHDPHGAVRGLVACTGIDYCHFTLIETKDVAIGTARQLEALLPHGHRFTTHWSGCPAGCGNHGAAERRPRRQEYRVNGKMVEAVDVFMSGKVGPQAKPGVKVLEDVPCEELPTVLERLIPYIGSKRRTHATT